MGTMGCQHIVGHTVDTLMMRPQAHHGQQCAQYIVGMTYANVMHARARVRIIYVAQLDGGDHLCTNE